MAQNRQRVREFRSRCQFHRKRESQRHVIACRTLTFRDCRTRLDSDSIIRNKGGGFGAAFQNRRKLNNEKTHSNCRHIDLGCGCREKRKTRRKSTLGITRYCSITNTCASWMYITSRGRKAPRIHIPIMWFIRLRQQGKVHFVRRQNGHPHGQSRPSDLAQCRDPRRRKCWENGRTCTGY
jgi:hypothetical protein